LRGSTGVMFGDSLGWAPKPHSPGAGKRPQFEAAEYAPRAPNFSHEEKLADIKPGNERLPPPLRRCLSPTLSPPAPPGLPAPPELAAMSFTDLVGLVTELRTGEPSGPGKFRPRGW